MVKTIDVRPQNGDYYYHHGNRSNVVLRLETTLLKLSTRFVYVFGPLMKYIAEFQWNFFAIPKQIDGFIEYHRSTSQKHLSTQRNIPEQTPSVVLWII